MAAVLLARSVHAHGQLEVPTEYPTIQAAIDAAHAGDVIFVHPGVYIEPVTIHAGSGLTCGPIVNGITDLIIIGSGAGQTIVDLGDHHHGFLLVGGSTNFQMNALTLRGSGGSLISALEGSSGMQITASVLDCLDPATSAITSTANDHLIHSCTLAGGGGSGIALAMPSALLNVRHCIFSEFALAATDPSMLTTAYCGFHNVGLPLPAGAGNLVADPLFADRVGGDFHLLSARGRFSAGVFVEDALSSPMIDAGDPVFSVLFESAPNGGRINLGAHGGSMEASRSPDLCAVNLCGDCNGDAFTNIIDALAVARIGVQLDLPPTRGSFRFDNCNVSGASMPAAAAQIDIIDALEIARFAAGSFPLACCP